MRGIAWLAGPVLLLMVPGGAADAARHEWVMVAFDQVQTQFDPAVSVGDLREEADVDRDGYVTEAEAQGFAWDLGPGAIPPGCLGGFDYAFIDGAPPATIEVSRFAHGLTGAVTADATEATAGLTVRLGFGPTGTRLRLRLGETDDLERLTTCVFDRGSVMFAAIVRPEYTQIFGGERQWIQPATVEPRHLSEELHGATLTLFDVRGRDNDTYVETNSLHLSGADAWAAYDAEVSFALGPRPPESPWPLAVAAAAIMAVIAVSLTEFGRFRWRTFLLSLSLFTRLARSKALDHQTRDRVVEFVGLNPGSRFADIRRQLGLAHGTLIHHLRVLETQRLLKVQRDGVRCRVYPQGTPLPPVPFAHRDQERILEILRSAPGTTQQELARRLGVPRKNAAYHLGVLEQRGEILSEREARWRKYYCRPQT
ncbi:MAG: helix-turn-helix domain-containing protein [Euryarchaeota archaeon]|nr:helix-turn-helix domain-containing protein [Euryarchaeota archaeon]